MKGEKGEEGRSVVAEEEGGNTDWREGLEGMEGEIKKKSEVVERVWKVKWEGEERMWIVE